MKELYEGDVVLDPFLGSGTTALACIKTNRKFVGIELNKDYVDLANGRIKELINRSMEKNKETPGRKIVDEYWADGEWHYAYSYKD